MSNLRDQEIRFNHDLGLLKQGISDILAKVEANNKQYEGEFDDLPDIIDEGDRLPAIQNYENVLVNQGQIRVAPGNDLGYLRNNELMLIDSDEDLRNFWNNRQ